ncbi:GPI mannosyltransferase 2, partial [Mucuna pruriens]
MVETSGQHGGPPSPDQHQVLVLKSAIYSRLLLVTLIILFRTLVSPYDTSAPLNPPCLSAPNATLLNHPSSLENAVVWDSVYFLRIAQCGYEYEQSFAFLPLLPFSASLFSFLALRPLLALSAYVINNLAFVLAALYLYKLSLTLLNHPQMALRAALLFCFNPASIFYSSIYSESLYALLCFGGMYHFVSGGNNLAVLFFALSGCARSNGVLNAGYLCFQTMHRAYHALFHKNHVTLALQIAIVGALRSACIFAPFVAFQAYGYYNMCVGRSPDEIRPWCKARIPGVGFLRYFQLKQLPNFLLASPILSLALCSVVYYAKSRPQNFFSLGFFTPMEEKNCVVFLSNDLSRSKETCNVEKSSVRVEEHFNLRRRKNVIKGDVANVPIESEPAEAWPGYLSASVLPFVLHLGFMACTAFFVMHVQVSTRFLSASPPLYWFASYIMAYPAKSFRWVCCFQTSILLLNEKKSRRFSLKAVALVEV